MKPLVRDNRNGTPKFRVEKTDHVGGYSKGISQYDKLTTKNANRSLTKGARQQSKLEIKELLNQINLYKPNE